MGVKKLKRNKPKPRPKPVVNYPPVPTRKWIPPDQRKKPPRPEPKYVKPEGVSQKLTISTLKKVWHNFDVCADGAALITGHFSQFHKRFSFKSNGLQGACNSAIACAYSRMYQMALWSSSLLDEILVRGDELYVRSTQQGDKCLIEVTPEKMHTSFFLGNQKITLFVSPNDKLTEELTSASEDKAMQIMVAAIETFLGSNDSGIFYVKDKYAALWISEGVYYLFDPGEHDQYGNQWKGVPGQGVSLLGRFKQLSTLVEYIFKNFPDAKEAYSKFHVVPCGIARIVDIDTNPPETFEDLAPRDLVFKEIIQEPSPPPDPRQEFLQKYVEEDKTPADPIHLQIQEMSPEIDDDLSESRRPSFLPEGRIDKHDMCRYPVPTPTYLKGEHARLTYYTDLAPGVMGILRGSTCQTNPNFSKYLGRQSMGNALSALTMLRLCKSKHWIPKVVDDILKFGEILYRDAMMTIPRTQSLRLSNFPETIEYENRKFAPDIDDYAVVGQLQSQDYDILDLEAALDDFLSDNDCCVILGPHVLAVWVEDGSYYMFDPNERDREGNAIERKAIANGESPSGVACVVWCKELKDLVDLYMNNTPKERRSERFYLSKVAVNDYVEVSADWFNFKGIDISKWILRGTFSQASVRFSPESRNTQGAANALVALAIALLSDESEWSSNTIDEILINGDIFYKESVNQLQEKGLFTEPHLMLSELRKSHKLRNKEADFELDECVVNGLIYARDGLDLREGLKRFFRDNNEAVLTTRDVSIAIWKKQDVYYYLDPYSRDEKGVATGYGLSCALRFLQLDDAVDAIEANLDPNAEDFFNIAKVKVTLYEAGAGGEVKPALNHYSALNDKSAILRGWSSDHSDKYEIRRGAQSVPMCVMAVGFNRLKPAAEWTKNDVDIILDKGDELYVESMALAHEQLDAEASAADQADEVQAGGDVKQIATSVATMKNEKPEGGEGDAEQQAEDEEGGDEEEESETEKELKITSANVKPEVNLGPNSLLVELVDVAEGNIRESLKDSIKSFFENEESDEESKQEALLETRHYTVAMWRDDKAYYIFDPSPRDRKGEVIGKEDWDPEPEPEPEPEEGIDPEVSKTEGEEGAVLSEQDPDLDLEREADQLDLIEAEPELEKNYYEEVTENVLDEQETIGEEIIEEEEAEEGEVQPPPKPKKSPSYWLEQEKSGRACTLWFTDLDDLANFVYENIPVPDRLKTDFELKALKLINNLRLKNKFNREDERTDAYAGDWYDFREIEQGRWILRGTLDLTHELFPESNRGKQGLTCSLMALGIAHTYEMTCFVETVSDTIMVYGDKLLTFMKRSRRKQLLTDPSVNLSEDEVDWLVQHEDFQIGDVPKRICVSKFMLEVSVDPNVIVGDVKAQNFEDVLDVRRGLETFFEDGSYGIMYAKGLYVAVWKGQRMYYMFDGMKRGPNGIRSAIGSGCLTRYLQLEKLAEVFLKNLPALGKNEFVIHKVNLSRNLCPRDREPKDVIPAPKAVPKTAGLKMVVPGKYIIRGTINQEDPRFIKGPNVMSAPIAIIALTMSLIHKPETWSRPIVDDIVVLGSELYEDSVNELGFDFNPWEDRLDVYKVKTDYKVGVVRANCELRSSDQKGVIDVKGADVQNLRQGMERFFEENTHGVLVTEPLTVALWEQKQDEGDALIYIFDPNPRSSTGMPLFTGTACVLSFVNAKMAADHVIGCILEPSLRAGEFVIVPVEIVLAFKGRIKKGPPEKSPTKSSINVLPRCSKLVASEQKKKLRKLAEEERRRKEAKRQQMIGRHGYHLKSGEAILRGYKSQNSEYYDAETRNRQDIPNCVASVVMHSLLPIDDWNSKHIDLILDTGDQLYIDSYIAYGPRDPKLGMENILRKFFMGILEIHVTVYKPIVTEEFTTNKLISVLEAYFQQENACILNCEGQWISVFFKAGYYFMFDPHERDIEGNLIQNGAPGTAVVVRFDTLASLALKIVNNLGGGTSNDLDTFSLWLISVESK